ncbi:MAG: glycoside hydrolase family 99-like domain-containing protein [Kiritimatiellae bacterium]|nr:glycoside hydrolase family 99-like domain-containing protein [Kiritimatiellia bacterium]
MKHSTAIIILGMHRSGTSALTGCLTHLGIPLGEPLVPRNFDNPRGFFELQDVVDLNERLFQHLGRSHLTPGPLPTDWQDDSEVFTFQQEAERLLTHHFANHHLFGLKDPRFCLTLPLWLKTFDRLAIKPVFILQYRQPLDSAISLSRRNRIPFETAVQLWIEHTLLAEAFTRPFPRQHVLMPELMADPIATLARLATDLGLAWPLPVDQRKEVILAFIDPNLLSPHKGVPEMSPVAINLLTLAQSMYAVLETNGLAGLQIYAKRHPIENHLHQLININFSSPRHAMDLVQLFIPVDDQYTEANSIRHNLHTKTWTRVSFVLTQPILSTSMGLRIDPRDSPGMLRIRSITIYSRSQPNHPLFTCSTKEDFAQLIIGGTTVRLTSKDGLFLAATDSDLQIFLPPLALPESVLPVNVDIDLRVEPAMMNKHELIVALTEVSQVVHQSIADHDAQITALSKAVAEHDAQIATLSKAVTDRDAQITALSKAVADRDAQIISLNQAIAERNAQITALSQSVADRDAQIAALYQSVTNLNQAVTDRERQIHKSTEEFNTARRDAERLNITINNILHSRSWRFMRPYRFIGKYIHLLLDLYWVWKSGLFDKQYYLKCNHDVTESGVSPLFHFVRHGAREGRNPNQLFDTNWYLQQNPDVAETGINPLVHYLRYGFQERRNPNPFFNITSYLERNPELIKAGIDPLTHYFLSRSSTPLEIQSESNTCEPMCVSADAVRTEICTIAFYLPQFHQISENDTWWGKGFTEWINTRRGQPQFPGHYQPHVPHADLGYYDLANTTVLEKQARLAKAFGIRGFCYHYYWFAGKRLLEKPIERMLISKTPDFPFCLCWANENWTRRWDGTEQEVLIQQAHSPKDDIAVIRDLLRYFRDSRYIRVDGRPLLLVYRADLLPDMAATLNRWRNECRAQGENEPYFLMVQSFNNFNPKPMGFDGAVQFPPHLPLEANGFQQIHVPGTAHDFRGYIHDYTHMIAQTLKYYDPALPAYPCVSPAWDNTARRGTNGTIFHGSTPDTYANWLRTVCELVRNHFPVDRRFVFINAWNEWAEGTHLEPDQKHGYAYLNATSRVLASLANAGDCCMDPQHRLKILIVGHDAAMAGAQMLLLHTMRWLKRHAAVDMHLCLLGDGLLRPAFEECCPVLLCPDANPSRETIASFCPSPDIIYGNSAVAACCYDALAHLGVPIVTSVHEMEQSLQRFASPATINKLLQHTTHYIIGSDPVGDNLVHNHGVAPALLTTINDFIEMDACPIPLDKQALRTRLSLPSTGKLVLGCGTRDWRKGVDLFVETARRILDSDPGGNISFCWVGPGEDPSIPNPLTLAKEYGIANRMFFVGERINAIEYFRAADIFLLPSREDPFPLVALMAAECCLPILCFEGSGGMPAFVRNGAGTVIPSQDVEAMAKETLIFLRDKELLDRVGKAARAKLLETHITDIAVPKILALLRRVAGKPHPVSVIVPNYNYARYLDGRLDSILSQTFRDMEIIVLDDASTDNSLEVLRRWQNRAAFRLLTNPTNSNNVSLQWKKGMEVARGTYIWIAEADDLCATDFLSNLLTPFNDKNIVLAFSIPEIIDEGGKLTHLDYRGNYLRFADNERWKHSYVTDGEEAILETLSIVNCIPNVSASLFRKPKDNSAIDAAMQFHYSGDWMFYIEHAKTGKVAYVHGNYALHRRHYQSVVASGKSADNRLLLTEIKRVHAYVAERFQPQKETLNKMRIFEDNVAQSHGGKR